MRDELAVNSEAGGNSILFGYFDFVRFLEVVLGFNDDRCRNNINDAEMLFDKVFWVHRV